MAIMWVGVYSKKYNVIIQVIVLLIINITLKIKHI